MEKHICTSYDASDKMSNLSIGYTNNRYYIYITISSINLLLNTFLIISFFLNKKDKKRSK